MCTAPRKPDSTAILPLPYLRPPTSCFRAPSIPGVSPHCSPLNPLPPPHPFRPLPPSCCIQSSPQRPSHPRAPLAWGGDLLALFLLSSSPAAPLLPRHVLSAPTLLNYPHCRAGLSSSAQLSRCHPLPSPCSLAPLRPSPDLSLASSCQRPAGPGPTLSEAHPSLMSLPGQHSPSWGNPVS